MLGRNAVRFDYTHAILKDGTIRGQRIDGGQRLSVMIRVSNFAEYRRTWRFSRYSGSVNIMSLFENAVLNSTIF
jgi:hypothetical protein